MHRPDPSSPTFVHAQFASVHAHCARSGFARRQHFDEVRLPSTARALVGIRGGFGVRVRGVSVDTTIVTEVDVCLPEGFPADLTASRSARGQGSGGAPVVIRNPILAGQLVVTAGDPEAASAVFSDPELTPELAATLLGHPGARIADGWLSLPVAGWASTETLDELIGAGVAFADAIKRWLAARTSDRTRALLQGQDPS